MMTSLTLLSGMKFEDDRCFSVKIKYVGEKGKVVHVVSDDRLKPKIDKHETLNIISLCDLSDRKSIANFNLLRLRR